MVSLNCFLVDTLTNTHTNTHGAGGDSQCEVFLWVAAVPQQPRPQLHADDAEDEEDKEAEEEDVTQHGKSVQQQVHEDAHALGHKHKNGLLAHRMSLSTHL